MGRHRTTRTPTGNDHHRTGGARRMSMRIVLIGLGCVLVLGGAPGTVAAGPGGSASAVETATAGRWTHWDRGSEAGTERAARDRHVRTPPGTASPRTARNTATPSPPSPTTGSTPVSPPARTPTPPGGGLLDAPGQRLSGVLAGAAELARRPTSGSAWTAVTAAAADRSGSVDLADQDSTHAARTLAAALVYARTGDAGHRDHVVSVLRQLPGSSLSGARVLSVSRQLAGYVLAADLVGYRDPAFLTYVGGLRTRDIGGHGRWTTIAGTSEDSANNWGTWAMATRVAVSAYLGDTADLARAAAVFRGFTGERASYAGFRPTSDFDPGWACGGGEAWVPINPASCGARGGALVEDISRSAGSAPAVDSTGLTYSWEALGGATLSARLLERAGYRDVWAWGDRALLRAAEFLRANGGYPAPFRVNQYIPHEINAAYGVALGPVGPAGHGRQFGFTDWLG
ncbi:alginate lyase family protein [Geodermatophilus ruber]|uniref:Alginate lyase n=1 Tax=Geodermatophilus ruber TaxID=504800 RepID=A0A1I4DIB5_9ACTN|nr:alginate lyase family protein [Geodermatophilus ruber]SFK92227.1 Alginate lyase [Geodermatophilus ruber]